MEKLIENATKSQTEIGWDKVKQGFISRDWVIAQCYYIDKTKQTHKHWKSILVRWMIEASWTMWKKRNQQIHGNTIKEAQENKIKHLQEVILVLYRQARVVHRFMEDRER